MSELEYENMYSALQISLANHEPIFFTYKALSAYIDSTHNNKLGLNLGESVISLLKKYPNDRRNRKSALGLIFVMYDMADRNIALTNYKEAENLARNILQITDSGIIMDPNEARHFRATILHLLGLCLEKQKRWIEAENTYKESLSIKDESDNEYSKAETYYQLGNLKKDNEDFNKDNEDFNKSEEFYQKALKIYMDLERYSEQANTYINLGNLALLQQNKAKANKLISKIKFSL